MQQIQSPVEMAHLMINLAFAVDIELNHYEKHTSHIEKMLMWKNNETF